MALYYILQHDTYAHPLTTEFVLNYPFLTSLGTHITVLFQLLFPTLIWFRKTRPFIIAVGCMLHGFGIALGMGLLFFGGLMCLVYGFFIEDQTAEPIVRTLCFRDRFQIITKPSKGIAATILRWSPGLNWGKALSHGELHTQSQTTDELVLLRLCDQKELRGGDALCALCRALPLTLPFYPFVYTLHYFGRLAVLISALPIESSAEHSMNEDPAGVDV